MKRVFFVLLCFIVSCNVLHAVPAFPYPVTVSTPSGDITITMKGCENMKYAITDDGYPLLQKDGIWYFASISEGEILSASGYQATATDKRSNELRSFLNKESARVHNTSIRGIAHGNNIQYDIKHGETGPFGVTEEGKTTVTGERKALVVLVQFEDLAMSKTQMDFDNLFNKPGYDEDGAKGSVYDYYNYASYGKLQIHSDIIGPFTLAHPMAYYGGNVGMGSNDCNPYAMFIEALEMARKSVNLSDYDQNNDGLIDNLHIIFAGYGEEAGAVSDAIWSHEALFNPVTVDGIRINRYSCAAELRENRGKGISRIGSHCHEIGHALGAHDYYDTDYDTGGQYPGTGKWDLMASGNWNERGVSPANFNPYVKAFDFGWCEVVDLTENTELRIKPSSEEDKVFRIANGNEYFLLENRQQKNFDTSVPGHGLLIYHINNNIQQA